MMYTGQHPNDLIENTAACFEMIGSDHKGHPFVESKMTMPRGDHRNCIDSPSMALGLVPTVGNSFDSVVDDDRVHWNNIRKAVVVGSIT